MSDDDGSTLDEMQSFACDIDLSDSEGEALQWPRNVGQTARDGGDGDTDDCDDDDSADSGHADGHLVSSATAPLDDEGSGDSVPQALQLGIPMQSRVEAMMSVEYWRKLCPQLHVSDPEFARKTVRAVFNFVDDPDTVDDLRTSMHRDGYVSMSAGEKLPWCVDLEAMASAVKTLIDHGWPPMMLTVYDETWAMAHQLKELLYLTTANSQIGDWSIFYVDPAVEGAAGWPPHRDRGTDESALAFRRDGTPKYCTIWVPLTDASTSNSCLTVVPRKFDPGYIEGDHGKNPLARIFSRPEIFQQIRSLPCPAGSLIAFTHRLLHWGSAADMYSGAAPRVAISFAAADPTFEPGYFAKKNEQFPFPDLDMRVALMAGNLLVYGQNEDPGPDRAALYWQSFLRCSSDFAQSYADRVTASKAWLDAQHKGLNPLASTQEGGSCSSVCSEAK